MSRISLITGPVTAPLTIRISAPVSDTRPGRTVTIGSRPAAHTPAFPGLAFPGLTWPGLADPDPEED